MSLYILLPFGSEKFGGGLFGSDFAYGEQVAPVHIGDRAPKCPVCGRSVGMLPWLEPHRVKLSSANPKKWGDFLWGAGGFRLMISGRFENIYLEEHLRGITHFHPPAEIVQAGKKKITDLAVKPPSYRLIDIIWGGAAVDLEASGIRTKRPATCNFCRYGDILLEQQRTVLEAGSWTGEDIFMPRGGGQNLVSERFRHVTEDHGLRNALLVPLEQYNYVYPGGWRIRPDTPLLSY